MLESEVVLQGRYRIHSRIGGGGMGTVYLAEDSRLRGRRCAIKEMSPAELAPQDRNWSIEAFRQEAQMLARLSHPGLTSVTDFFPDQGNWYLVMDYVEGETLAARLARAPGGRFDLDEALRIVRQLLGVLAYLHDQPSQVIFRDLKPSNVMCTPEGQIKLIDFGIARFFKPGKAQDTLFLGSPGYAAPEQYGGMGQSDPRTDIYSLGVVLLHMVTGYDPTTSVTPFPIPDPRTLMPTMPDRIAEVIAKATQLRPELRYASVEEMREALFAGSGPPTSGSGTHVMSRPLSEPEGKKAGLRGSGIWLGVGVAVLLLAACGGTSLLALSQGLIKLPGLTEGASVTPSTELTATPSLTPFVDGMSAQVEAADVTMAPGDVLTPEASAESRAATPTLTVAPSPTTTPTPRPLRIAYVRGSVGNTDIYVANEDGRGARCVACEPCDEAEPAWSTDGDRLVYQSDCAGSYDIWIVPATGGAPTRLTHTDDIDEREPDWAPDGTQLAYRAAPLGLARNEDSELYLMERDGSGREGLGVVGRSPVWSPDGNGLVFMSERTGSWQVYVHDLVSGQTRKLTNCTANCRWPAWSRDGRAVVYHSTTGPGSVTADTIWMVSLDGSTPTQLVSGGHAGRPTWSGSMESTGGGVIAFNSDRGIEIVTAQGENRRVLIQDDESWAPVWSP